MYADFTKFIPFLDKLNKLAILPAPMDRKQNPFAPGAGTRPPELAGRDQILEDAGVALARVKA